MTKDKLTIKQNNIKKYKITQTAKQINLQVLDKCWVLSVWNLIHLLIMQEVLYMTDCWLNIHEPVTYVLCTITLEG